ncbi:cyclodeaminase/cyclohydrolase family protein [Ammoniphilus sp. YIM 78166]|uniref:cyclodeaminase/cyclohydrolase family protein n=1 Tax=Ammoniphilus sp. YIM 78166 TaxID=1644106 RepID=UPI00107013BF|nr:cyclodeaminase/cyclohydrolase family protein [Ammoniphilus sp. YIM 78166]
MVAPYELSIHEYLRQLGSDAPTPGGGSTSAVVASLGAAMALMAANITLRSRKEEPNIQALVKAFQPITEGFEQQCLEDIYSFQEVMDTLRKKAGEELLQTAIQKAAEAPLEIARLCLKALELCEQLAPLIQKNVASDLGCAILFLRSACEGSLLTMKINLRYLTDPELVQSLLKEKERLELACREQVNRTMGRVEDKLKKIRGTSHV